MTEAKQWFYNLPAIKRDKLSLKYRNTYAYGIFKDEAFLEIYNKENVSK